MQHIVAEACLLYYSCVVVGVSKYTVGSFLSSRPILSVFCCFPTSSLVVELILSNTPGLFWVYSLEFNFIILILPDAHITAGLATPTTWTPDLMVLALRDHASVARVVLLHIVP